MNSESQKISILIVGATGALGTFITKHCLTKPNLLVNVLVRDPKKNPELVASVEKAGGKVFIGDIAEPDTWKGISKGIHTAIFSLPSFGEKITVDGQIALIKDCVENGVKRIVPSEFSENTTKFSPEELSPCPPFGNKRQVLEYCRKLPVKTLAINTGVILDTYFPYMQAEEFGYWGDINRRYDFTSYEDTAKFVAAAVARADLEGDIVFVSNKNTITEVAQAYNKVRGTNISPKRFGSLEELRTLSEDFQKKGDFKGMLFWLYSLIYDDRANFDKTNNSEFPEVQTTSIEQFFKENPNIKLNASLDTQK